MKVDEVMEALGVFTGSIDSSKLGSLNKVKGVSHVEAERQYQIAPPLSNVQ